MISVISSIKSFFERARPRSQLSSDNFGKFKDLPTDLQYKIFESIGGIGAQVNMLNSVLDLQKAVIRRDVIKAYNFFSSSLEGSPAKIAFNAAVKEINSDEVILSVTYEKITNLALKNLLNMLSNFRKTKLDKLFGPYSLSLEKIKTAQTLLLNDSLLEMWFQVKDKIVEMRLCTLRELHSEVGINHNVEKVRKWLENNYNIVQQINELSLEGLKIIPPELSYFTGLTFLNICNGKLKDISILENLENLTELWIYENQIDDISPLENLENLRLLQMANNPIKDIKPLEKLENLTQLCLPDNQIRDIRPLENHANLQVVFI